MAVSGKGLTQGWPLFSILQTAREPHDISHIQRIDWRKGRSEDSAEMGNQNWQWQPLSSFVLPSTALPPVAWSHHGTTREFSGLKTKGWLPRARFIGQIARWLVGSKGGLLRIRKREQDHLTLHPGHSSVSAGSRAVYTSLALARFPSAYCEWFSPWSIFRDVLR